MYLGVRMVIRFKCQKTADISEKVKNFDCANADPCFLMSYVSQLLALFILFVPLLIYIYFYVIVYSQCHTVSFLHTSGSC